VCVVFAHDMPHYGDRSSSAARCVNGVELLLIKFFLCVWHFVSSQSPSTDTYPTHTMPPLRMARSSRLRSRSTARCPTTLLSAFTASSKTTSVCTFSSKSASHRCDRPSLSSSPPPTPPHPPPPPIALLDSNTLHMLQMTLCPSMRCNLLVLSAVNHHARGRTRSR
jgi:hypothetical protein